ncbi:MAG: hypothetical protein VST71_00470 [Nitrospirota bacterium]|nr:hypothetical protein [Nitrospirota bacterium]
MWPIWYASPQELRTKTGDGRDLVVLSGYAGFHLKGSGGSWRHVTGEMVRGPVWNRLDDVASIVSLAAIGNDHHAVDAGWAVDWCNWYNLNHQVYLKFGLAIRDIDGWLYRVTYHITAVGVI